MEVTSPTPLAKFGFVNRVEEMERIQKALKEARDGKGQLLIIRGEAGSGKTRLVQEATVKAEELEFNMGFGTALTESVTPYHLWKDVLTGLGLEAILEEWPPPKLLGLYVVTLEGRVLIRVERENTDKKQLTYMVKILEKSVRESPNAEDYEWTEGRLSSIREKGNKVILSRASDFTVGAIIEGQENEKFLTDMLTICDSVASLAHDARCGDANTDEIKSQLQQLLDSRKYEGIDYSRGSPKLRQGRFFDHVTLGIVRKSAFQPVLIVLDDLQWADPSSLALLHYLSRNTKKERVLLLGTYRIEEVQARINLMDTLKGMQQERLLNEMELKGLSRKDLPDLAGSFIGAHDLREDFLDLLWQETQGNPLFVREMLKGLEEERAIIVHGTVKRLVRPLDQLALPKRIREVIRVRLERLSQEDRRLLDAAATCGARFTAALVAKVAGEEEEKVVNGLKSIAHVHGLLRTSDSDFSFNHSAIQEVLHNTMSDVTSQAYHMKAAEWLELAGGPLEDVAEHYYHSHSPRAVPRLRAAADAALERYANIEAARLLGEALELAPAEDRGEILELQADAFEAGAHYDEALAVLNEALRIGAPFVRCKRKVASVRIYQGLFDNALATCEEAYSKSEGIERGQLLALQAEALMKKGEYSRAKEQANAALDIFGESGDPRSRADALTTIGYVHLFEGHYDEAEKTLTEVLVIREAIGDRHAIGLSLNNLGNVLMRRGEYNRALEIYNQGLRIREAIGDLAGVSASLNNIGNIYSAQGNFPRALELYKQALGIAETIGNRLWIANQTNNVAAAYYHLGNLDKAIEYYERSFEMKEASGNPEGSVRTLMNMAYCHHWRGDLDRTFECFEKSLSISKEMDNKDCIASSLAGLGLVYTDRGDFPSALRMLNRAMAIADELGLYCRASVLDVLTRGLIHSRNLEEARKRAEEHLAIARKNSMKLEEANSLFNLARCETACGNPENARREFSRAIQLYEELKAVLDIANCHLELGLAERRWGNEKEARKFLQKALELFESRNLAMKAKKAREALGASDAEA